jgi:hypothetical protein
MCKGPISIAVIATLQLMVNQAMSQPNCDVVKIAESYVRTRYPFIDIADREAVTSATDALWQVTFELPQGALGFVPIISIDRKTCAVVRAEVEQ